MTGNRTNDVIKTLRGSFNGKPWYGISMMEKLNTINWRYANEKPSGYSKSIAILLKHMINWRIFALKKLQGDADFDIEINSGGDWSEIQIHNEQEWNSLLKQLQETQNDLLQTLSECEDAHLERKVPGRKYDFFFLIKGISEHDIYHLGQIAILNTMLNS